MKDPAMKQANPINIQGLDHVVLRTTNLEAMVSFYTDVLGCRLERGPGDIGLAQLRAGEALIDLVDIDGPLGGDGARAPDHAAPNMDHFCIRIMPWSPDAIVAHLRAHDIDVGEVAQRYGAAGSGPSLYIKDPEGNTVELKGTP